MYLGVPLRFRCFKKFLSLPLALKGVQEFFKTVKRSLEMHSFISITIFKIIKLFKMNNLSVQSNDIKLSVAHNSNHLDEHKIANFLNLPKGIKVNSVSIAYLKAESNYTYLFFKNGSSILISKTLKYAEQIFGNDFIRVHQSYLINKNEVQCYNRVTGILTLNGGQNILASRSKKKQVYLQLQ